MKTRNPRLPHLLSFMLWLVPATSLAAPPGEKRDRDSDPGFLSDTEVPRIEQVERFEVLVEPLEENPTAQHLSEACRGLSEELVKLQITSDGSANGSSVLVEAKGGTPGALVDAIHELRLTVGSGSPSVAQVKTVAELLVNVGWDIDQLCTKISTGTLQEPDIAVLRSVFREHAETILRYEQLLTKTVADKTTVAKLAVELSKNAPLSDEDRKRFVNAVLSVDLTGRPRSFGTGVNLGAVASKAFDGLAEFLIDRAKEEALQYIRDTLVKRVCNSDTGVFVPKTCKVMTDLDASMALSAIGKMLHAAVVDDLEVLPDRVLVLTWSRAAEFAYSATLVRVALPMLEDAELRNNPLDYAASIHAMPPADCEKAKWVDGSGDAHCAETLAYLRLTSALLRAAANNVETLTAKPTYKEAQVPFLTLGVAFELEGLFAELLPSAREYIAGQLKWKLESGELVLAKADIDRLDDLISESISVAASLEATLIGLSQPNAFGESTATSASVVIVARSAIVGIATLAQLAATLDEARPANDPFLAMLDDSSKLVAMSDAIRGEDWGSSTLALFDTIDEMVELQGHDEVTVTVEVIFEELGRYLPLFVEIANAKSSADVKAALEAAFPAGGYRLKYRQPAVALNGFLGIYGGGLFLTGANQQLTAEAAMFAPIGVETTWPVKSATRKAWHLGFLLAVVDLGAITTAKFLETELADPPKDDMGNDIDGDVITTEEPSKFNIAALLSPGAYFTVGVAESPFSLGLGASVNPFALQQVERSYVGGEVDSQSQSYLTAVRFGAFLAVDITMFAFGRKGRQKH
jgi:hypothetical protein